MNLSYVNELQALRKWVEDTTVSLQISMPIVVLNPQMTIQRIEAVALGIENEYPCYSDELRQISRTLFVNDAFFHCSLNQVAFGELSFIIRQIEREPVSMDFWREVHPRIKELSYNLYRDGYFVSAADKAVKEVEDCLREKYKKLNPGVGVPSAVADVIGALLSKDGKFRFCDVSTESGRNYRRGIQALAEGLMAAYRNLSMHKNVRFERHEVIEQIMIASRLMYILDMKSQF